MDSHDFDRVKSEKANALARYRRFRNIAKLLQVVEVFVALTLISWSLTRLPSAVKSSGAYLLQLSSYLLNPHVVFLVGNAIVLAVYVLSRHSDAASETGTAEDVKNSEIEIYRRTADDTSDGGEQPLSQPPVTEETSGEDNHSHNRIVCFENAVAETGCEAATAAIQHAKKRMERFQRTQSEKLKSEISVKPRQELRRSATEIERFQSTKSKREGRELLRSETETRRMIVTASHQQRTMTSFDGVERLSSEEFRLKVEAFISKQQMFLKAQIMDEK